MKQSHLTDLADLIRELNDRDETLDFLRGILTDRELADVSQRLQIVKLLKQGMTQREVAQELGVGIATVTRGAKEIQKGRFKKVSA